MCFWLGFVPGSVSDVQAAYRVGTYYHHTDHLGSASMVTDKDGNTVEKIQYLPFGEIHTRNGDSHTNYYYTGQEKDDESGLYYYGARFYKPELGRFIQADPVIQVLDSQDINAYSYCRNNPVILSDPTGEFDVVSQLIGISVGVIAGIIGTPSLGISVYSTVSSTLEAHAEGADLHKALGLGIMMFAASTMASSVTQGILTDYFAAQSAAGTLSGGQALFSSAMGSMMGGITGGALGAEITGGDVANAALGGAAAAIGSFIGARYVDLSFAVHLGSGLAAEIQGEDFWEGALNSLLYNAAYVVASYAILSPHMHKIPEGKSASENADYSHIKIGDIIYFAPGSKLVGLLSGGPFSHVGIVVGFEDGVPVIGHCARKARYDSGRVQKGAQQTKFSDKYYRGRKYMIVRPKGNIKDFVKLATKFSDSGNPSCYKYWIGSGRRVCSSFVRTMAREAGVVGVTSYGPNGQYIMLREYWVK